MEPEPCDGDLVCRRVKAQLRAGDRRERDRIRSHTRDVARVEYSGSIMDIASLYDLDEVRGLGGIVDYTVGPPTSRSSVSPSTPIRSSAGISSSTNLGKGPLYPFWIPYHLPHFETPNAIARVALLGDVPRTAAGLPHRGGLRRCQARSEGRRGSG